MDTAFVPVHIGQSAFGCGHRRAIISSHAGRCYPVRRFRILSKGNLSQSVDSVGVGEKSLGYNNGVSPSDTAEEFAQKLNERHEKHLYKSNSEYSAIDDPEDSSRQSAFSMFLRKGSDFSHLDDPQDSSPESAFSHFVNKRDKEIFALDDPQDSSLESAFSRFLEKWKTKSTSMDDQQDSSFHSAFSRFLELKKAEPPSMDDPDDSSFHSAFSRFLEQKKAELSMDDLNDSSFHSAFSRFLELEKERVSMDDPEDSSYQSAFSRFLEMKPAESSSLDDPEDSSPESAFSLFLKDDSLKADSGLTSLDDLEDSSLESAFSRFVNDRDAKIFSLDDPEDTSLESAFSRFLKGKDSKLSPLDDPEDSSPESAFSRFPELAGAGKDGTGKEVRATGLRGFLERFILFRGRKRQGAVMTATGSDSSITDDGSALKAGAATELKLDYVSAAKALWRVGWLTWWVQLVMTVISGVILGFSFAFPGVSIRSSASLVGFGLSGTGVLIAFMSLFWTYSYTRLSVWLSKNPERSAEQARARITGKLRVGLLLSIAGMAISLLGVQAVVGTLLARLFSSGMAGAPYATYQTVPPYGIAPGAGLVQPVDVLVVQAGANAMIGLLAALITTVWLRARANKWQSS